MSEHRYILEPYNGMKSRYRCPSCNKGKTFSLYLDTETGNAIAPNVGRCNREINCGYHYTPRQYYQDNSHLLEYRPVQSYLKQQLKHAVQKTKSVISHEIFKASLKNPDNNNFVQFLLGKFGSEITTELISRYFIGSSKQWNGATVFWQIDITGKIRTGKIMLYNAGNGKRVKEPFNYISWAHKALNLPGFELEQCLFGEHLLKSDPYKPVAIVESEKTAIISSVYLPQFLWLAVGSLTNLTPEKCAVLKDRTITLFPDLKCYEKWSSKARELSSLATFNVSDLLERKATLSDKDRGLDLADYLIQFDPEEITLPSQPATNTNFESPVIESLEDQFDSEPFPFYPVYDNIEVPQPKIENWAQDISALEKYFTSVTLPSQPVRLNPFSTITNVNHFILSHLEFVKANNGKRSFLPYLNRLMELKGYLIKEQN